MDLTKGYWQVPVAAVDRPKTSFSTPHGLFQFTMMPLGLKGAPATFQHLTDSVTHGLDNFVLAYQDDLIIFSTTFEEHLDHIRVVLTRLREAGLTGKSQKCFLGLNHCRYLGHIVGGGTMQPKQDKVESIRNFAIPVKDVRAFLGLAGYYRKFITIFASIALALTDCTKKAASSTVQWSTHCNTAFITLK
uniref:Reverse transcriptase domain-containing protein n=1 Tax=Amphimedon queenslandica TaxID=400682 RepID=A0A1X7US32_AMPQE